MKQNSVLFLKVVFILIFTSFYVFVKAQSISIKGNVVDKSGPVIGASVVIDGTTIGTITDFDGNFNLSDVPNNGFIKVSFIGYQTQTIPVNGRNIINVELVEDNKVLDEVVVVGYGVQRKSDLTGAVSSVKTADALKATPTGNVSEALQGRMAGVTVFSGSGDPSQDNTIRVRGINSITAETGPLVVIDGFIGGSLKSLNPADIASIEVLKDASATAVYGSQGANGVILVTTKNPEKNKLTVSFNGFANIKTVSKYPNILSPYEYANIVNDYTDEYYKGTKEHYYDAEQLKAFENGTAGFQYSREIFRDPALMQNYELSISGGSDKTTFLASFRYENNEGVIKASESQMFNWRLKVDTELKKWLKTGVNIYGFYSDSSNPLMAEYDGLIQHAYYFPNTIEPKDENGNYNNAFIDGSGSYNPMGHIWEANNSDKTVNNRLQGYIQFDIIDGLSFRSQLGVELENRLYTTVEGEKSYEVYKRGLTLAKAQSYWNLGWINTNTLSYIKEFNKKHRINATAVFEQSYNNDYNHSGTGRNLDYPELLGENSLGASQANLAIVSSNREITTLMSGMFRLNYVFMDRYMLTASIRADGSSRLKEHWDYFPSAALAWNIKQENFMKDVDWLNQFKFRLGYGSVGNQSVEPYRYFSQMKPVTNSDGTTSYQVGRPQAEYLKWERNDQFNIGFDMSFLNGRLSLTGDWYNKLSKDILLDLAQPSHMGYTSLLKNSGEIRNKGVEFTISADPFVGKNFSWHTDLTLSHNKSVYEKIPTYNKRQVLAGNYQQQIFQMIEGEKLGSFWGFEHDGIWQEDEVNALFVDANGNTNGKTNGDVYKVVAGNTKYVDVNKDGTFNDSDRKIIGCGQPTFNWGWNNSLTFKDFDFSFFIIGFHGFDIYNATRHMGYKSINAQTFCFVTPMPDWLDRWTPENTDSDIPGFVSGGTEKKNMFNTYFVEDGSFVKIKNITLGYSLPKEICNSAGINNLRLYVSVQNPFQITKYSGLDPEATMGSPLIQGVDWAAYPNSRNFLVGLNFSF